MTEGKMIQEMVGAISWAKNGAFSEKKCQKIAVDAAKAYAAAQVAAKDAEIDRLTFQLSEANRVLEAHRVVAASRSENIAALKADNARMRGGIREAIEEGNELLDESDIILEIFNELEALLSPADGDTDHTLHQSNTDLAAMLKEQVEENARLVDRIRTFQPSTDPIEDWSEPIDGIMHVPDEFDKLINKAGHHYRVFAISQRITEPEMLCRIVISCQAFFQQRQIADRP